MSVPLGGNVFSVCPVLGRFEVAGAGRHRRNVCTGALRAAGQTNELGVRAGLVRGFVYQFNVEQTINVGDSGWYECASFGVLHGRASDYFFRADYGFVDGFFSSIDLAYRVQLHRWISLSPLAGAAVLAFMDFDKRIEPYLGFRLGFFERLHLDVRAAKNIKPHLSYRWRFYF